MNRHYALAAFAGLTMLVPKACDTPVEPEPCSRWLTEQQVIDGALIAAPPCEYNVSYASPARCEMWGGTWHPLGCFDIDQRLAVTVWITGP